MHTLRSGSWVSRIGLQVGRYLWRCTSSTAAKIRTYTACSLNVKPNLFEMQVLLPLWYACGVRSGTVCDRPQIWVLHCLGSRLGPYNLQHGRSNNDNSDLCCIQLSHFIMSCLDYRQYEVHCYEFELGKILLSRPFVRVILHLRACRF